MKQYHASTIKNIAIAGHGGSGKTTLVEALLHATGSSERLGRVEDGTTVSDWDPEEIKRGISVSLSVCPMVFRGCKINLLDTPGQFDFAAGLYEGVRAAESVLLTVSGKSGVTVGAQKAYRLAKKQNALAIVNGESIGQVASQTLESMQTINDVTRMPIIRPLACMDKVEIIDLARKIGTYETSIQPWEDCCTIFTPKNPVTKPTIRRAEWMESHFDFEQLVDACVENCESLLIYPDKKEEETEDLF